MGSAQSASTLVAATLLNAHTHRHRQTDTQRDANTQRWELIRRERL